MADYFEERPGTVEAGPTPQQMAPHRGTLILVLGILGLVCCFICGIVAWVFANTDLREMATGRMDPSGRGLTQAGKICGIISVAWQIVVMVIWLMMMIFAVGSGAMSV
jgi:hypothetical protein